MLVASNEIHVFVSTWGVWVTNWPTASSPGGPEKVSTTIKHDKIKYKYKYKYKYYYKCKYKYKYKNKYNWPTDQRVAKEVSTTTKMTAGVHLNKMPFLDAQASLAPTHVSLLVRW